MSLFFCLTPFVMACVVLLVGHLVDRIVSAALALLSPSASEVSSTFSELLASSNMLWSSQT